MCGISGELQFHDAPARPEAVVARLSELMARRGPDDAGVWRDGERAWLAFRRLAILDLSPAGHQPMLTADGRFALVFNGEIYNFADLRPDLEREGVRFRSTGDTEVVLYALAHWGPRALERFNGMFALGFYDRQERSLLLARDHAGIKPLYYLLGNDGVFFASQYDQILAHPWRDGLPVSAEGLGLYLRLGYIPAPYALLERTHMLEAGSWLRVGLDARSERGVYYAFPVFRRPDLSGEEAGEAVDAAVSAAVRRQMVSDVPLGAFLSGGIDSPLVAAKMGSGQGRRIRAYTIGSAGSPFDESEDAVAYARELGLDHVLEQFAPDQALDWLDHVVTACGEPFADPSIFPTLLVSHLARRDLTVALSGDGGDELFWGYAQRSGSIIRRAADFRRPHWLRSARRGVNRGDDYRHLRWPTIGDWQLAKHTLILPGALASVFDEAPAWPETLDLYRYDGWEPEATAQWLRWNEFTGHLAKVLLKVDRASMANSLEVRVPLLDREVIDVATRIDWRSCLDLNSGTGKLPLRRALSRHAAFQTGPKRGFQLPMADWFRGPLKSVFRETMLERRELLGLEVNRAAMGQLLDDHTSGRAELSRSLWSLLSLGLWSDRHFERVPEATAL
jgi:asparagine synthase (glutamine-hydrolysing)